MWLFISLFICKYLLGYKNSHNEGQQRLYYRLKKCILCIIKYAQKGQDKENLIDMKH